MSQIVVGMAGHIDHGKTSIIKSLTGTKTERYTEEIERGLTIDIGFAFLNENITLIDEIMIGLHNLCITYTGHEEITNKITSIIILFNITLTNIYYILFFKNIIFKNF